MSNVQKIEQQPEPRAVAAVTPMDMLNRAVETGAGLEMVEKLMGLQERWEATQNLKAFNEAVASAKAEIKPIVRNATGHNSKKYADFSAVANAVDPILSKYGLSYRHRAAQAERITVTCVLSHRAGHCEETPLSSAPDKTGSKNDIQAIGSALTYLQRYTLMLALGLAAATDDDGKASAGGVISEDQAAELIALADEVNADKRAFCEYFKIDGIAMMPAKDFDRAKIALNKKRAK